MIINAPFLFTFIWKIMSLWFDERTLKKICIVGSDYKERLHELVEIDCLPERFGGTCKCEEFGGCKVSDQGVWTMHQDYDKYRG